MLDPKLCLLPPSCSIDKGFAEVEAVVGEGEVFAIAVAASDSPGIF